jgi:glycosyltransferase involved in cell wall biosynthesis
MKIAFIYDCLYPYVKGGGEKRYYEIEQRLKNEHEVHFFSMRFWKGANDIFKDGIRYHGVCKSKKLYTESGRRSIFQAIYFGLKLFKSLFKEKFDIVDCSAFPQFSVFVVWIYSKIKKVPVIFTWHEYWGLKYWLEYLGILGILGALIEKFALFFSKNIITVSEFTKKRLIKAGKNKKNIVVISNGIDYEKIKEVSPYFERSDLIFAGRLIKEKNVDLLINAVAIIKTKFSEIKCIIIGDGPEKNKLTNLAKQLKLEKNIIFTGFLEKYEDVYRYFKSSKIFVLPSIREGFGIVVLEANACGLPVITINHANNAAKNLIRNNYNGFICQLDFHNVAMHIKNILCDPILFNNLKMRSIEFAQKCGWENIINDLVNYYQKTINENNSNSS